MTRSELMGRRLCAALDAVERSAAGDREGAAEAFRVAVAAHRDLAALELGARLSHASVTAHVLADLEEARAAEVSDGG